MQTTLSKTILAATRCYFGGPDTPKPPDPPKPPAPTQAANNVAANERRKRKPLNYQSSILTTDDNGQKTLLGQ
jgi:hypothetical protein